MKGESRMPTVLTAQPGVPVLTIEDGPKSPFLSALESFLCYVHVLHDLAMEDSEHFGPSVQNPQLPEQPIVFNEEMQTALAAFDIAFNR